MKYYDQLIAAVYNEDFFLTNDILSLIKKEDDNIEYVNNLLIFMENNPDVDYGMPGPIVHFMERYYNSGYEDLLYNSIERKPTFHTLWMLNRILNSPTLTEKEKYLSIMREIADNNPSDLLRREAQNYLKYQDNK